MTTNTVDKQDNIDPLIGSCVYVQTINSIIICSQRAFAQTINNIIIATGEIANFIRTCLKQKH